MPRIPPDQLPPTVHVVVNITPLFAVALELGHRCVE